MDEKLKALYEAVSQDYNVGTYEEFSTKLQDPAKQKAFYDGVGKDYELGTFDEFSAKLAPPASVEAEPTYETGQLEEVNITAPRVNPMGILAQEQIPFDFARESNPELVQTVATQDLNKDLAKQKRLREINQTYNEAQGQGAVEAIQAHIEQPTPEQIGVFESMGNSFSNLANRLKGTIPRLNVVSADVWENVLGKEMAKKAYEFEGRDINKVRADAYAELEQLAQEVQPTLGLVNSIETQNWAGLSAGLVNTITSLGSTAIPALATGGAGLFTEMTGDALFDFNEAKAKRLGKSVKQLYADDEAEFEIPAMIGAASGALELIGLKGVNNLITNKIKGTGFKKALIYFGETQKEGLTELFQQGLSAANVALANGGTPDDADKAFSDAMFSKEGLEAYLQGVVGAAGAGGLAHVTRNIISPKAKTSINEEVAKINMLELELKKPEVSEEAKVVLQEQANKAVSNIAETIEADETVESKIPEAKKEQAAELSGKIDELNAVVTDENVAPAVKTEIETQVKPLEDELSSIVEEPQKSTVAPKNIVEAFKGGAEGISAYREIAKQQFLAEVKKSRGNASALFNPEGAKALLEYAILSVADGTLKSAKMLADAFGVKESKQIKDIFNQATTSAQEYLESNPDLQAANTRQGEILVETQSIADKAASEELSSLEEKKLTDYARKLYDSGNVQTAEQFQEFLGVKNPVVAKAFNNVVKEVTNKSVEQSKVGVEPTTKQKVQKGTEGKIQGTTTISNKEALTNQIKTLDKGIREGIKGTYKNLSVANKEFTGILKNMLNSKNEQSKISGRTHTRLVTELSKADNKTKLQAFSNKLLKVVNDSKYLDKLDQVAKSKKKIRTLLNKNIPADLKTRLREMLGINPAYINKIDELVDVLNQTSKLLESPTKALQRGTDLSFQSDAIKALKSIDLATKKLTDEYKQGRIEVIKQQLEDAGIDTSVIEALYPNDPDALLQTLTETLNEGKESLIDKYRKTSEVLLDMVKADEVDTSEMSEQDIAYINEEVKNINIDGIPDNQVAALTAGLTNLVNYGSLTGFGQVVADSKVYVNSLDKSLISRIDKAIKIPNVVLQKLFDNLSSGTMRKDVRVKNQLAIPLIDRITGVSGLNLNTTKYNNYTTGLKKALETLRKKYSKDLKSTVDNAKLGIYADVAQYRSSWTPEQVESEYRLRLKAWVKSLDALKARSEKSVEFKRDNKFNIENLEKALNQIITITRNDQGAVEDVNLKMTKDQLFESLPEGQKKFYELSRKEFDGLKEDFFFNSRVNNNIDIEADWVGYTPRTYDFIGSDSRKIEKLGDQAKNISIWDSFTLAGQTEVSKSGKSRTITGDGLPQNSVLSADFVDTFINSISKMAYDINTQSDRLYVARALDINRSPIVEKFSDVGVFDTYNALATQKVSETIAMMGGNFTHRNVVLQAYSLMGKLGVAQTLAGFFAAPKQAVEIVNIAVKTQQALAMAVGQYFGANREQVKELLKLSNVAHRETIMTDVPESGLHRAANDSKAVSAMLGRAGIKLEKGVDKLTELSLKPLTSVDKLAAELGWLSFYIEYQKKTNPEAEVYSIDPAKINREAVDYANHQTSATLNESDATQKSTFSKNLFVKTHFLFSSFAINSKMELLANLSRLSMAGNDVARGRALRNVVANLTGLFAFNKLSQYLKIATIYAGTSLVSGIISSSVDDEEKKKDLLKVVEEESRVRLLKNEVNSTKYLLQDFLYGGIGGEAMGLVFNPAIDFFQQNNFTPEQLKDAGYGKEFTKSKLEEATALMGLAGLPIRRGADFFKALGSATQTDEEFILQRHGVLSSDLDSMVVDDYRLSSEGKEEYGVPNYARMIDTYSAISAGVSMLGASLQEVGNIRKISTALKTKLIDEDRGKIKAKDVEKAVKDASTVLNLKLANGGEMPLTAKQQQEYKTIRASVAKKLAKEYPYSDFKDEMTREEYEVEQRKAVDDEASDVMGEKYQVITEQVESKLIDEEAREDSYREKAIKFKKKSNGSK